MSGEDKFKKLEQQEPESQKADSQQCDSDTEDSQSPQSAAAEALLRRCPQCAAEVQDDATDCPLCQAQLQGTFSLNQDLVEESVEGIIALLRAEFDLKALRLASDTDQLMARAKIREMVREDVLPLTIFERGVVLQHILNIIFNSRDEENL